MQDKAATLAKAHENNLLALIRDYRQVLHRYFGDRIEQVIRSWYDQERRRFEHPNGLEAKVLDFVPVLTRRAVEERIRQLLEGREHALEGAA